MDSITIKKGNDTWIVPVDDWDKYKVGEVKSNLYWPTLDKDNRNGYDWLDAVKGASGIVYHPGRDFNRSAGMQDLGDPVFSMADGVVTLCRNQGGWGNHMFVRHDNLMHPTFGLMKRCFSHYAHLSAMGISEGRKVRAGEIIGRVGNTGASTAAHLHFEIRKRALGETFYSWGKSKDWVVENYHSPDDFLIDANMGG